MQLQYFILFILFYLIIPWDGIMKLLSAPKIPNGTGEAQPTAVFELLEKQNLTERIHLTSFDITSSNSGVNTGACVLLEKKSKRPSQFSMSTPYIETYY